VCSEQAITHLPAIPAFETALHLGLAGRRQAQRVERWAAVLPVFTRHRWRRVRLHPPFGRWHELPWRALRRPLEAGKRATPAALGSPIPQRRAGAPGVGVSQPTRIASAGEFALSRSGKPDRPRPISLPVLSLQWPAVVRANRRRRAVAAPTTALVTLLRISKPPGRAAVNSNAIRLPAADGSTNAALGSTGDPAPAWRATPVEPSTEPVSSSVGATAREIRQNDVRMPGRGEVRRGDRNDATHSRSREQLAGHQNFEFPVRTRAHLISGVATSLYDRLRTEITLMRTMIRQEVTERIDAAETARASVTAPQPRRDPVTLLQNVEVLDVLNRRMRSLNQEERFRLGRLR
jgi:hypothetical protein